MKHKNFIKAIAISSAIYALGTSYPNIAALTGGVLVGAMSSTLSKQNKKLQRFGVLIGYGLVVGGLLESSNSTIKTLAASVVGSQVLENADSAIQTLSFGILTVITQYLIDSKEKYQQSKPVKP